MRAALGPLPTAIVGEYDGARSPLGPVTAAPAGGIAPPREPAAGDAARDIGHAYSTASLNAKTGLSKSIRVLRVNRIALRDDEFRLRFVA